MKDLIQTTLPSLPIVGNLKVTRTICGLYTEIIPTKDKRSRNLSRIEEACYEEFLKYLQGQSKKITLPFLLGGINPFQEKILSQLEKITYGSIKSYKQIADGMNTKAYQAIGSGCGRNPLLIIFPCHRVVGTNGPGGFAHGLKMKRLLLELEGIFLP